MHGEFRRVRSILDIVEMTLKPDEAYNYRAHRKDNVGLPCSACTNRGWGFTQCLSL